MAAEKEIVSDAEEPVVQAGNLDFADSTHDGVPESPLDYPEGGFQAWLVVSGASAVMFCTFGYLTGFG